MGQCCSCCCGSKATQVLDTANKIGDAALASANLAAASSATSSRDSKKSSIKKVKVKGRALLIGINYMTSPSNRLHGCIADTDNIAAYLVDELGFEASKIVRMRDDTLSPADALYPTAAHMRIQIHKFVSSLSSGELGVLHFSGHGGLTVDRDGDEVDGKDETWYGADLEQIVDDEIKGMLKCPRGATLMVISDSCHSGTVVDAGYAWDAVQSMWKPSSASSSTALRVEGDVLCISGCRDDQTSADAFLNKQACGAMTACLLQALRDDPALKIGNVVGVVTNLLRTKGFVQRPMLTSNTPLARSRLFPLDAPASVSIDTKKKNENKKDKAANVV